MTDLKYQLLDALYRAPEHTMKMSDLLNPYLGNNLETAQAAYFELLEDELITEGSGIVKLPKATRRLYESERERREERAKQAAEKADEERAKTVQAEKDKKQQFRHDFIVATVSTCIGSALTLIVEHFVELVNAISFLFS